MPHPDEDALALTALGEPAPSVERHVRDCGSCAAELVALQATVDAARSADLAPLPRPPAQVWQRITDELGLQAGAEASDRQDSPPRRLPWRRPLRVGAAALAAAAVVAVAVVAVGVVRQPDPAPVPLVALGQLQARGEVVLADLPEGRALLVDTSGLPEADGSYEVWLLDLDDDRLVALGVLDDTGHGELTVPSGVRVSEYPTVDISLEPHDGDPGHSGQSVLRGDLPDGR